MNQTREIGVNVALMKTGGIVKYLPGRKPEPLEPEKKCVISVVDMWSKAKRTGDKVSFYLYDKEKFGDKIWIGDDKEEEHTVEDADPFDRDKPISPTKYCFEPIGSTNYCYPSASYITFGSLLFRVGGENLTYCERTKLEDDWVAGVNFDLTDYIWRATRTVDIIDLESGEDLMMATKGPKMNYPRLRPHLLILQGNLYVAGGFFEMTEMDVVFMEVLNKSKAATSDWFWETVPNPPPFRDNEIPNVSILTGAVESEGVIVVGFQGHEGFFFYAYQTTTRTWTTYIYINLVGQAIGNLSKRPAVMSGKLMLWLTEFCTLLYVMDLENNKLITIDLFEKKLLPRIKRLGPDSPVLLKLDEGKFCVFWADGYGPHYKCGQHVYTGFHASTFTLKAHNGTLHVKLIKRHFSLIPAWKTGRLMEVCIADFPDAKRRNKTWTPFC